MDWVLDKVVDQSDCGASVGNTKITDLVFADDTVIFAESLEVLVMALEALHEEAKPLRLEVSWLKTKVQVFGDLLDEAVQSVHACGEDIEILESFTYLGSAVHNDGGSRQEVLRRIGIAHGVMNSLSGSIWRCRYLCRRTKIRIFKSLVIPVLLYGCETWTLNTDLKRRINAFGGHVYLFEKADKTDDIHSLPQQDARHGPPTLAFKFARRHSFDAEAGSRPCRILFVVVLKDLLSESKSCLAEQQLGWWNRRSNHRRDLELWLANNEEPPDGLTFLRWTASLEAWRECGLSTEEAPDTARPGMREMNCPAGRDKVTVSALTKVAPCCPPSLLNRGRLACPVPTITGRPYEVHVLLSIAQGCYFSHGLGE
ncbi:hypothetical protein GWK47_022710 [Chionoecetes opilio]|uniref:Reverse transcriptase domain-containing protein n=1 Tax=Chionoecetes opilio TaxID=41210 RepID=A0A8J4XWR4_CHIOP|nr:hypothetical protein GWK47_022710 [Chionoecetes opilio]